MTVRKLIAQLSKLPPTTLVILSSDSEGNSYSPVADISSVKYDADSTYSGGVYDHDDEEAPGKPAVILYPTN